MKRTSGRLALLAGALIFLCAVAGCKNNFTVTLDRGSYTAGDSGTATLANKSPVTAYLPGCSQFNYEKLVDGQWTDQGPAVVCVWEGDAVPVSVGGTLESAFIAKDTGSWRLRYLVAFGCTEGKPLSQADCKTQVTIYSPQFQVAGGSQDTGCVESGGTVKHGKLLPEQRRFPQYVPGRRLRVRARVQP